MHIHCPPPSPAIVTRRDALRQLGAGSLLALGWWPGCAAVKPAPIARAEEFRFLVVNDTHYLTPECGRYLEGVVRQMKTHEAVDFCLLVGDLADTGEAEQLSPVREIFAGLGVPVHVQIGNHDYLKPDDRRAYEKTFLGQINYEFEHRGWQLVGLDSTEGQKYEKTTIQPATFRWLDDHLPKLEKSKPTVLFTHFPLGEKVTYRPLNAEALLERFREFNLVSVFNGHFHGYTESQVRQAVVTTNRCCSFKRGNHDNTKEKGYFLCTAKDGKITRTFVEFQA